MHRPQRHGAGVDPAAAVRSELEWLLALREEAGLDVRGPVRTRDGSLATTARADGADGPRVCSLLRWIDVWPLLPPPVRTAARRVADRAGDAMARLAEGPDVFGLVHADLHLENVLFARDGVRLLDFDDCGYGYRVYDLAVAFALWFAGTAQVNPAFAGELEETPAWSRRGLDGLGFG